MCPAINLKRCIDLLLILKIKRTYNTLKKKETEKSLKRYKKIFRNYTKNSNLKNTNI